MRRVFGWSILLVLILFGLLWPLVIRGGGESVPVDDPVVFSNHKADYRVDPDGNLDVVETVTAEFPSGRHGLFWLWPTSNKNDPYVRQVADVKSVTLDGAPAPYRMLWTDGKQFRVAKVGDPDEYLGFGTHVFEMRYSIPGALEPGTTGADLTFAESTGDEAPAESVFFWNVVGGLWNNRMEHAEITVTMPGDITGAQCSVGVGVGTPCKDLTVSGNRIALSADYLGSHTPVTLRAGVDVPTPATEKLSWPNTWDRILGQSMTDMALILSLAVAFALGGFLWYRTTVESSPGFPLQYAPPQGLGPVQTEYIRTEAVPKNALTATLFDLAERKIDLAAAGQRRALASSWPGRTSRSWDIWIRSAASSARTQSQSAGFRIRGEEVGEIRRKAEQGEDRHRQGGRRSGPSTERPDGQTPQGVVGPHCQRDRVRS